MQFNEKNESPISWTENHKINHWKANSCGTKHRSVLLHCSQPVKFHICKSSQKRSLDLFKSAFHLVTCSCICVYTLIERYSVDGTTTISLTENAFYWAVFHRSWERERLHKTLQWKMFIRRSACVREEIHGAEWWCTVLVFTHSNRLLPPASKRTHAHIHSPEAKPYPHSYTYWWAGWWCDVMQWRVRLCKFYSLRSLELHF